jgi:uncharacterized protein (DUF952 family)
LAHQAKAIAEKYYAGKDYIIWRIPVNKLGDGLKLEANKPGGTKYPHYYGKIDLTGLKSIDIVQNVDSLE